MCETKVETVALMEHVYTLGIGRRESTCRPIIRANYCVGQPWSMSCSTSCAAFISPTRSGGGEPAACIYTILAVYHD